ncbi:MAG: hypothetical protein QOF48_2734, partial [Verrucomicrobiota bacterium]
QTFEGEVSFSKTGELVIQTLDGLRHFPIDQVQLARFNVPKTAEIRLPRGWQAENIGDVQGGSIEKENSFDLRAAGGSVKEVRQQMAHFAYRIVRADGEFTARLTHQSAGPRSLAGIMFRENLEASGGLAVLGVKGGRLQMESREASHAAVQHSDFGAVQLPLWLRLARQTRDNLVVAFRSRDGVAWQKLGQARLFCPSEPFPDGAEHYRPRILAGLAVTGTSNTVTASGKFDQVGLSVRGLLGEYFGDEDFRRCRFARPDSRVEFFWGLGSPSPDIDKDHFAIRWTGEVEPKYSENYRFLLDAQGSARLWVLGAEIQKSAWKAREKNKPAPAGELLLVAGRKYPVQIDFKAGEGVASVRFGWNSDSQPLETVPSGALSYHYTPASPDEDGTEPSTNALPARGILLRGGSFLAMEVRSADDTSTAVTFAGRTDYSIQNTRIAQVIFRPSKRAPVLDLARTRPGLFMKNGDYFEGDFQSVTGRTLVVSSVLLGRKKYNLDRAGVVALVLNPVLHQAFEFDVQLLDGSSLRASRVRAAGERVIVTDTTLGEVSIAPSDLAEIRRHSVATVRPASPVVH